MWSRLWQDVTNSARRLLKSPTYASFSVLTLTVGIGATSAAVATARAVLMPPPNSPVLEQVVNLYHKDPRQGGSLRSHSFAWVEYEAVRTGATVFDAVLANAPFRHSVTFRSGAELAWGEVVSGNYFDALDVRPVLGRVMLPSDDSQSAPAVAVISHTLWQKAYGGSTTAIGSLVQVNGHVFEVVGVAPQVFRGTYASEILPTSIWIALAHADRLSGPGQQFSVNSTDPDRRWLLMRGRLRPTTTVATATSQIASIAATLDRQYPLPVDERALRTQASTGRQWAVIPAMDIRLHGQERFFRPLTTAALTALLVVVLIACTNIASITVARMKRRSQEMVVRAALGASRFQIMREQLVESVLLSVGGCGCGLALAYALMILISREIDVGAGNTISIAPVFDIFLVFVAFGMSCVTLAFFGLVPVWSTVRRNLRETLGHDGDLAIAPRWSLRKRLVAVQVCVSVALFSAAAICALRIHQEFRKTSALDLEHLAILQMAPASANASVDNSYATLDTVAQLLSRELSTESVALASGVPPLTETPNADIIGTQFARGGFRVRLVASTPNFFETVGLSRIRGRLFLASDAAGTDVVAIVSRRLSERLSESGDVLDQSLQYRRSRWTGEDPWPLETVRIVGVVEETGTAYNDGRQNLVLYVPLAQRPERSLAIVARSTKDPDTVAASMVKAFRAVNPEHSVRIVGSADKLAAAHTLLPRFGGFLMSFLGVSALVLALVGLYGILTFGVTARRREVGIRMALGATEREVVNLIVKDGLTPVALGLCLGVVTAALMWNSAARVLQLSEPNYFRIVIPMLIASISLTAGYVACRIPANSAARVDPAVTLRHL